MLERGWLAHNQFKPSFAHSKKDIVQYLDSVAEVFKELSILIQNGEDLLRKVAASNPAPTIPRLTK
jgi:hypothetical protein